MKDITQIDPRSERLTLVQYLLLVLAIAFFIFLLLDAPPSASKQQNDGVVMSELLHTTV